MLAVYEDHQRVSGAVPSSPKQHRLSLSVGLPVLPTRRRKAASTPGSWEAKAVDMQEEVRSATLGNVGERPHPQPHHRFNEAWIRLSTSVNLADG